MDLIYGSALWYASTKVNCHFVAEGLARERPTLFVESVGARLPRVHEWRRLLPRLIRSVRPLRRLAPNLWVFSPLPLPLYRGGGAQANSRWVGLQVRTLLALRRWRVEASWIFHPMGLGTARAAGAPATLYYCVDDHAANPGVDPAAIRELEAALVRTADLTIVTGAPLAERLGGLAQRLEVVPNVADTELFGQASPPADHPVIAALDALPRPRLGYLGNLAAYKIDMALLTALAWHRPDWTIALVGPRNQGDVRREVRGDAAPPNLRFLGEVPHGFAPAVIDRFDVALLPSAEHEVMQASFPLKFFEYLLRGKPVVARPLPALQPFREWYAEAGTMEEFEAQIEQVLRADGPEPADRRRAFAGQYGWAEKMRRLGELRDEASRIRSPEAPGRQRAG